MIYQCETQFLWQILYYTCGRKIAQTVNNTVQILRNNLQFERKLKGVQWFLIACISCLVTHPTGKLLCFLSSWMSHCEYIEISYRAAWRDEDRLCTVRWRRVAWSENLQYYSHTCSIKDQEFSRPCCKYFECDLIMIVPMI